MGSKNKANRQKSALKRRMSDIERHSNYEPMLINGVMLSANGHDHRFGIAANDVNALKEKLAL